MALFSVSEFTRENLITSQAAPRWINNYPFTFRIDLHPNSITMQVSCFVTKRFSLCFFLFFLVLVGWGNYLGIGLFGGHLKTAFNTAMTSYAYSPSCNF